MTFSSREEAGRELGRQLLERGVKADIVLGLPRGGVIVAAKVARILQCPLDVLVVRKIGHPRQREFAVGAMAEPDVVILDQCADGESMGVTDTDLQSVIAEETMRLKSYQTKFHPIGAAVLTGKIVLIIDDGLATGATAEAAVASVRKQMAHRILVATPIASSSAAERLRQVAEGVVALFEDPEFVAVGRYYDSFLQTTDEEVLALLHIHA